MFMDGYMSLSALYALHNKYIYIYVCLRVWLDVLMIITIIDLFLRICLMVENYKEMWQYKLEVALLSIIVIYLIKNVQRLIQIDDERRFK